jgi:hypothetical protein
LDRHATGVYWIVAVIVFGGLAYAFCLDAYVHLPVRDLWQHLAALRALIADPVHPDSPFIPGSGVSRHFHPYWFAVAMIARTMGWSEWSAIHFAAWLCMAVLAIGIYLFGRAYYRSNWGPLALMSAMLLGWTAPFGHTGLHSIPSLFEAAAYPATLLIGLSFILWWLTIRAFERVALSLAVTPLVAFMFATHQLGAGIALIGSGAILTFWPAVDLRKRAFIGLAILAGLAISAAWPLFNPFRAVLAAGNPHWVGPPDFYSPKLLLMCLLPSAIGFLGLLRPVVPETRRVFLSAFAVYLAAFLCGLAGIMVASRFLMPTILLLHLGVGSLIIRVFRGEIARTLRSRIVVAAIAWGCVLTHVSAVAFTYVKEAPRARAIGNIANHAAVLTADIPDDEPIAAYDVSVWPVVASGQKAMSVPWPEPFIPDLDERQRVSDLLFEPSLTRAQRLSLARRYGVRTLIVDQRFAVRRHPNFLRLVVLLQQSRSVRRRGPLWRFNLE